VIGFKIDVNSPPSPPPPPPPTSTILTHQSSYVEHETHEHTHNNARHKMTSLGKFNERSIMSYDQLVN
jgi:hypothetical protein